MIRFECRPGAFISVCLLFQALLQANVEGNSAQARAQWHGDKHSFDH